MSHLQKGSCASRVVVPAAGETFTSEDGTVSVVLADTVDPNYEPSREEIEVFAEWMGMKLPEDNEFLHIAREGLKAPLPDDWRPCCTNDDEIYYFNFRTGESTWNHPMDDSFREKFINEKKKKEMDLGASPMAKKDISSTTLNTASTREGESHTVSILKKPLADVVSGTPASTFNTFVPVPVLGAARPVVSGVTASLNERVPVDVLKKAPTKSTLSGGGTERRIVSEVEKNLEDKIRQEREAEFKAEEERAEAAHEATIQDMRREHDEEIQKEQEQLAARLAEIQSRAAKEQRDFTVKKLRELEEKWKIILNQVLEEEQSLQQQLSKLREQHTQRVASEVARVENAAREQQEREQRQREMEITASLEKIKEEARAEFMVKKDELQLKSQDEKQRLIDAEKKRHEAEMAALRKKYTEKVNKDDGAANGAVEVAAIQAKEKEEVAAIVQKSKEEQSALRTTMEATLSQLRREIYELESSTTVLPSTLADSTLTECLEEIRRRWQEEEQNCMHTLMEERRKKLAILEQPLLPTTATLSSTPSFSSAALDRGCKGLSAADEAALNAKEKALRETELLLRDTLQKELTRKSASTDVLIAEAIQGEMNVFVRETEVQRRFEREEFERRHDRVLAEHEKAMEANKRKMVEQKLGLEEGFKMEIEEVMQDVVAAEVDRALKAMKVEKEAAQKNLQQRYQDERRVLFTAVDEEMLEYERKGRCVVDAEEEAKAKQKEEEMRAVAVRKVMTEMEQTKMKMLDEEMNVKAKSQSPCAFGVPMDVLQRQLNSIEQTYMEQEQKLQGELESIKAETQRLREVLAVQERGLSLREFQPTPQLAFSTQKPEPQKNGSATPEVAPAAVFPSYTREKRYASPFTSEALRFLNEQQRELTMRRGALNAAREEWQNEIRGVSGCVPSTLRSAKQSTDHTKGDDVSPQLLTLVSSLGDLLRDLTGKFGKLQTKTVNSFSHRQGGQRRLNFARCHNGKEDDVGERNNNSDKKTKELPHNEQSQRIPVEEQAYLGYMQKWCQILLEFASPSSYNSEVSKAIQHYVTGG